MTFSRYILVCALSCLCWLNGFAQTEESRQDTAAQYVYKWHYLRIEPCLEMPDCPEIRWKSKKTDRGIFGGQVLGMRIYGDITMPTITSECLVDIGRAMSGWGGLLGMCPRWFTMFNPLACPQDELFGSPKANTAIMVTMRTYF